MKKIFFCLISSCIIFQFTYGQSWQKYDSLRLVYQEKQSFDTALIYAEKAALAVKELKGENDTLYAKMLTALMEVNYYMGNYTKAIEYCEKEREIRKKLQGTKHPDYSAAVNNLALLYQTTGNYKSAETMFIEAIDIYKDAMGTNNVGYASMLNNLAVLYDDMGKFDAAEAIYSEVIKIDKKLLGEKDPSYATDLSNLAGLYMEMANYTAAEPLYIEVRTILKEAYGTKHTSYAKCLNNLAFLYQAIANYAAAEPLFIEALNIRKEVLGENHISYASSLNNLAVMYYEMGNYEAAEPLFVEAKDIRKRVLGENHPSYALSLNNIAQIYQDQEKYTAAESLLVEVVNIDRQSLGDKHPEYAQALNNLAGLYRAMGLYSKAEPLLIESKNVYSQVVGENHPGYALALNNLAALYNDMGKYSEAVPLFTESVNIRREVLGKNHQYYPFTVKSLAWVYFKMGEYNTADILFSEAIQIVNDIIKQNFAFLSEKEKEMYFKTMTNVYEDFYYFSLNRKEGNTEVTKNVYNNVVKNKGLLLKSSTALRTAILSSKDTALISSYEKWIGLKKEVSKLYSTEVSKRKKNPEELEQNANSLEKELVKNSQIFNDFEKMQNINWEAVKNSLKPGEAAIEFIRFPENRKKDSILYCALLITSQSKQPEMIRLFYEKELAFILGSGKTNNFSYIKRIYGTNQNTNERLYRLIWQPIEPFLTGIKTIYYSPDGLLHKISFSSIGKGKDVFLCDNYSLYRLSSTGKIVFPERFGLGKNISVGIFGGIDYSADSSSDNVWPYLEGTKSEADKINQIFKSKKINTTYMTGKKAGEKEFKETAGSDQLIHIATHGFFFPEPEIIKKEVPDTLIAFRGVSNGFAEWQFVKNKNPLMRSGLVMAGANNVWSQRFMPEGEDGVLTAMEVAQLDMQKTQLVVMSACETGLGEIKGSEGVYGLQRSFKMAGVKYLIMSLWQVPDMETSEFMTLFYEKLLQTKDIRKSFNETQWIMRKKYDPFYWAAFVLIE